MRFERRIKNGQALHKYKREKEHAQLVAQPEAPVVSIIEGRAQQVKSEQEKRASVILNHIRKLIHVDVQEAQRVKQMIELARLKSEQRRRDPAYAKHVLLKEKYRRLQLGAWHG
jgi:hypothetical protein